MRRILALSFLALGALSSNAQKKPNVICILADDIGYQDLSCYGARKISTPNLDNLAANGVRFTNAYSPASTSSMGHRTKRILRVGRKRHQTY